MNLRRIRPPEKILTTLRQRVPLAMLAQKPPAQERGAMGTGEEEQPEIPNWHLMAECCTTAFTADGRSQQRPSRQPRKCRLLFASESKRTDASQISRLLGRRATSWWTNP